MEEQFSGPVAAAPAKMKGGIGKLIAINIVITVLVALVVSLIVIAPLMNRVKVLEQEMAKQMAVYKTK